jgi:hypothetical protein
MRRMPAFPATPASIGEARWVPFVLLALASCAGAEIRPKSFPASEEDYSLLVDQHCKKNWNREACRHSLINLASFHERMGRWSRSFRTYQILLMVDPDDAASAQRAERVRAYVAAEEQRHLDPLAPPALLRISFSSRGGGAVDRLEVLVDYAPLAWTRGQPLDPKEVRIRVGRHSILLGAVYHDRSGQRIEIHTSSYLVSGAGASIVMKVSVDLDAKDPRIDAVTDPPKMLEGFTTPDPTAERAPSPDTGLTVPTMKDAAARQGELPDGHPLDSGLAPTEAWRRSYLHFR